MQRATAEGSASAHGASRDISDQDSVMVAMNERPSRLARSLLSRHRLLACSREGSSSSERFRPRSSDWTRIGPASTSARSSSA